MDMKKSVTIVSSTMVRPAVETPRRTLWLSRLDMVRRQPFSHSHVLFIYEPTPSVSTSLDVDIVKESLSKVLVSFYPIAGRLKINETNGRYEIDCNSEGALFIEAETTNTLSDLGDGLDPQTDNLGKRLSPSWDYSEGLSTILLLMVQLTRFKCGGVCLGFSQHHHVADGSSHVHFMNSWGELARGLEITVKPVHDKFKYVAPRDPPRIMFQDLHYLDPPLPPMATYAGESSTIESVFKLSKAQIEILRQEATSPQNRPSYKSTTFTVLAGHIWRNACKARNLADDQDVKLYVPVNGRFILDNPKLPSGYFGNTIVCGVCKAKAGDIIHNPLWYVVSKVCEAIAKMKDSESFRSVIDYIETQPSLEPLIRRENWFACPNLSINDWTKFSVDKNDFGWGAPKFMRHVRATYEGQSTLLPNQTEDGSLLLKIRLYSVHMASFEKYIYEIRELSG